MSKGMGRRLQSGTSEACGGYRSSVSSLSSHHSAPELHPREQLQNLQRLTDPFCLLHV